MIKPFTHITCEAPTARENLALTHSLCLHQARDSRPNLDRVVHKLNYSYKGSHIILTTFSSCAPSQHPGRILTQEFSSTWHHLQAPNPEAPWVSGNLETQLGAATPEYWKLQTSFSFENIYLKECELTLQASSTTTDRDRRERSECRGMEPYRTERDAGARGSLYMRFPAVEKEWSRGQRTASRIHLAFVCLNFHSTVGTVHWASPAWRALLASPPPLYRTTEILFWLHIFEIFFFWGGGVGGEIGNVIFLLLISCMPGPLWPWAVGPPLGKWGGGHRGNHPAGYHEWIICLKQIKSTHWRSNYCARPHLFYTNFKDELFHFCLTLKDSLSSIRSLWTYFKRFSIIYQSTLIYNVFLRVNLATSSWSL